MSCRGCEETAQEKNKELTNLIIIAKNQAHETNTAKAICSDEIQGKFITDAATAIRERFRILQIVSGLR